MHLHHFWHHRPKQERVEYKFNFEMVEVTPDILSPDQRNFLEFSIQHDFIAMEELTPDIRQNDTYKAIKFTFDCHRIHILHECVVITKIDAGVAYGQYLLVFRPTEGLSMLTQNGRHRTRHCDVELEDDANPCFLTYDLQCILVDMNEFKVWSYIPVCDLELVTCPFKSRPLEQRKNLFS